MEKLLSNLIEFPKEDKYKQINTNNIKLECLFKYKNGILLLNLCGFERFNEEIYKNMCENVFYLKLLKSNLNAAYENVL